MAQWIRPRTLNREVPGLNQLAAAVVPTGMALYPHCLVPRKGLKAVARWARKKQTRTLMPTYIDATLGGDAPALSNVQKWAAELQTRPPPPPPIEFTRGPYMRIPIFSGKGVFCGRLSREDFPEKKNGKRGCFKTNLPRYGVFFRSLPRN